MAGLSEAEKLNGIVTGVQDHYNEIVKNESASGGESIKPFCVDGAIMQCTMGSAPGKLTVIDHGVAITGKYAAHDEDRVPGTNIPSFGTCAATGKPCAPSPVPKWLLTDEFSLMTNKRGAAATSAENCALITDSILVCMQGGIIKFVTSGQMMTVGDVIDLLKTVLFLLNTLLIANQLNKTEKSPANTGLFKDKDMESSEDLSKKLSDIFKSISENTSANMPKPATMEQKQEQMDSIVKNLEDLSKELSDIFAGIAEYNSENMPRPATLEEQKEQIKKGMLELQNGLDRLNEIWDKINITDAEKDYNYQNNIKQSLEEVPGILDSSGRIIHQGKLEKYLYGSYTANQNSCGAIATYNVLKGFGKNPEFSEILKIYEDQNSPLIGGKFGTWQADIYRYFVDNGYSVDCSFRKDSMKKIAESADTNIIFYGGKSTATGGVFGHYIEAVPVGDGKFHFYNDIYGEENDIRTWDEFFSTYKGVQICYSISKPDEED